MATSLFKLVMNSTTTTTTNAHPAVSKYFYNVLVQDKVLDTISIPATRFTDDAGNTMTGNLTTILTNNGHYVLTINAQMQQSSLFTVSGTGSSVVITQASTVPLGAPITLAVHNFSPISSSITTVTG
ncbi:DUF4183 domain-containing protein [Clostridiaceae bacterium M8S5]|nr:DUF4183 domain-containing protein [Clostridiaceae bacterium M8S5]